MLIINLYKRGYFLFKIIWKPNAARQIEKIKDSGTCKAIFKSIENLINFPSCINIKSLKNHEYAYRLRVGRYRVFFNVINSVQIVSIEEVKKRDESTY